jgi:hypothetical protein
MKKLDTIADSAAQMYAHQHTVTINSRRRVLEFEANEVERAVVALSSALSNQKRRRNQIAATLRGLASVVEKR